MKTVGIISEYNPFHLGHKRQFDLIREAYGADTRIVCVMSGNYVQRGEPALTDKFTRAEMAVRNGADLVLSFPFPFCVSGAGYFGRWGVHILRSLGVIDVLSFGCETADTALLTQVAQAENSEEFAYRIKHNLASHTSEMRNYAHARESALLACCPGLDPGFLRAPNNSLALAYVRALGETDSGISLFPIRRNLPHDHPAIRDGFASASLIREAFWEQREDQVRDTVPPDVFDALCRARSEGRLLPGPRALSSPILAHLRLGGIPEATFGCSSALRNRLLRTLALASDFAGWVELAHSATYADATVRRAILHSFFGTPAAVTHEVPHFSQVLGFDRVGRSLLHEIKRNGNISLLTKPADLCDLPPQARQQAEAETVADRVYPCFFPDGKTSGDFFLRQKPFFLG